MSMNVAFLDLQRGFREIADEVSAAMARVAASGHYILGPEVKALEAAAADYLDVPHVLTCASGTDALHLAMRAAGIGAGDEVITTPFTFAATVEAVEYVGATAVLVDIDADTFNIDPQRIEDALTPQTRAIAPVHLFGLSADMDAISSIARQHELVVIEDAAQSLGGRFGTRQTGSTGDFGAFSLYPSKTLGAFGDAGMVACHTEEHYERLLQLRNHGFDRGGEHVRLGYNSRLDEMQAAIVAIKLPRLDSAIERRRQIATWYDNAFAGISADLQQEPDDCYHARGYYTLCVDDRDSVRAKLRADGVATALYYGKSLHRHAHYSESCQYGDLSTTDHIANRCLALPIYPELTDAEVEYVAEALVRATR